TMSTAHRLTMLRVLPIVLVSVTTLVFATPRSDAYDQPAAGSRLPVDFERHVAPLFGRLGCNSAACHGAFGGGRGGMQLSLFGYSPEVDYRAIEDRIDPTDAELSLLLLKPSGLEPHEGGVRFTPDSDAYQTIRRWIEQGALREAGSGRVASLTVDPPQLVLDGNAATSPVDSQSLAVIAQFADGTREIVTHLCQFASLDENVAVVNTDGSVVGGNPGDTSLTVSYGNAFASVSVLVPRSSATRPSSKSSDPPGNSIDARIMEKLTRLRIEPSGPAGDEEFLRRLTIDVIGTIPSVADIEEFCADSDPHKRERKIDEMLSHPMHAALWATRMCDVTKCDAAAMGEDELAGNRRAQMWHDWFRRRFELNASYAEIARGVVTATSREGLGVREWMENEEELIHRSRESFENAYAQRDTLDLYWRRAGTDREEVLKANAELTAVAFTGVRLNCAQCHKHPFDRWTQDDYAAFANIFSRVMYGSSTEVNGAILTELARRRDAKQRELIVRALPRIREVYVSTKSGSGISGSQPGISVSPRAFDSQTFEESADLRNQFYEWLVADDNPYFARNFVNRVWAVYFGVGVVDPVDGFSAANPPSHPQLLDELAQEFRDSHFDIRALERRILTSDAYQRTSAPNETNLDDRRNYARQYVRPMLAETALDAINKALGATEIFGDAAREGALAIEVGTNRLPGHAERVLQLLGRGQRESTCDCDRRTESDLRQFLLLASDAAIAAKISNGSIRSLLSLGDDALVTHLYLRTLGRRPSESEIAVSLLHLSDAEERDAAFDDLLWALLNSREFITNH
ncbi:MAG: DUF1549 domain-containing protein, partial [Planctomycetota bacterium]